MNHFIRVDRANRAGPSAHSTLCSNYLVQSNFDHTWQHCLGFCKYHAYPPADRYAALSQRKHHHDVYAAKHNKHDTAFGSGHYCVFQAALSQGVDQRDDPSDHDIAHFLKAFCLKQMCLVAGGRGKV